MPRRTRAAGPPDCGEFSSGSTCVRPAVVRVIAVILMSACNGATPAPMPWGPACGVERWAVKTLSDAGATRVNLANVIPTTISALNALPAHCSALPEDRTFGEEFRVYEVLGLVRVANDEADRDVHVVLADPA